MESAKERLAQLREQMDEERNNPPRKKNKLISKIKLYAGIGAAVVALGLGVGYKDYLTKRQDYAKRNILFSAQNVTKLSGNVEGGTHSKADLESVTKFYKGGEEGSKLGTYYCESSREVRGREELYNLRDANFPSVASANQTPERLQSGISIWGSLNYREHVAELYDHGGLKDKMPLRYTVHKITPERGWENRDIDVVHNKDGTRKIINRLIEPRNFIGLFKGKHYRDGTILQDYTLTEKNTEIEKKILEKIKLMGSDAAKDEAARERILLEMTDLEEQMDHVTIYTSFEDGFLKVLPQASTLYLGHHPSTSERLKHWAGFGRKERHRLTIENYFDFFPGYLPLMSEFSIGSGEDEMYPFDKYNNGGYIINDKYGKIAEIKIEDFFFRFGQDVLYSYFLDLNGDGELDKEKELIGQVVCRASHDERKTISEFSGKSKPDRDLTYSMLFSFMSPNQDKELGLKYFELCAYIESMMPDQVHRGDGQHSLLKLINDQRSDVMLYKSQSIENLSRGLTQESTLAAKYDIIKVLNAAQRPYARELAHLYGVEKEFEGQFQTSPLLRERFEIGPLPGIAIALAALYGGVYYFRHRKKNKKTAQERLKILQKNSNEESSAVVTTNSGENLNTNNGEN